MRPLLIDLFCCAGGAAAGYHRAGFEVIGIDVRDQPRYPYAFFKADALGFLERLIKSKSRPAAVHASPPCQRYSDLAKLNRNAHEHPDLVDPTRELLERLDVPYVIENVEGAPLRDPVTLCGTMFPGLRVIRHRLFETNWPLGAPVHPDDRHPLVHTFDRRKAHYGKTDEWKDFVQVTGGGNCSKAAAADAMGIDWMTKEELNEALPPAYTKYIGDQLLALVYARLSAW